MYSIYIIRMYISNTRASVYVCIYICISDYINVLSDSLCMPMPFQPSNQRTCIKQRGMAIQLHCCTSIVSFFWIFTSLVVTHTQLRCLPKGIFTPNNRCILDVVMCQDFDIFRPLGGDDHSQELPAELDKTIAVTGFFRRVVLRSRESPKGGDQT